MQWSYPPAIVCCVMLNEQAWKRIYLCYSKVSFHGISLVVVLFGCWREGVGYFDDCEVALGGDSEGWAP